MDPWVNGSRLKGYHVPTQTVLWNPNITSLTISNNRRTNFSDSPLYFDVSVEDETLKNVVPHSVATALASMVLPVPGGPAISTPWNSKGHTKWLIRLMCFLIEYQQLLMYTKPFPSKDKLNCHSKLMAHWARISFHRQKKQKWRMVSQKVSNQRYSEMG